MNDSMFILKFIIAIVVIYAVVETYSFTALFFGVAAILIADYVINQLKRNEEIERQLEREKIEMLMKSEQQKKGGSE